MKSLLLRTAPTLAALSMLVTLAGCGGLASTTVNLPVPLSAMRVWAGATQPSFARQSVNEKASGWQQYDGLDMNIDSARFKTATLINRTGSAETPVAAVVHIYVSDAEYTSSAAVAEHAVLLMDVAAPAGQSTTSFDSSFVAVPYDASAIMRDGVFWVYAVSANAGNDVELLNVDLTLKARVWLV